jgi:hypothetical protein
MIITQPVAAGMDTDVHALVRVPWEDLSAKDIARVHATIAHHHDAIGHIEDEIGALAQTIARLRTRQRAHQAALGEARALLSAARRVPADVLADIIQYCVGAGWWRAPRVLARLNSAWLQASRAPRVWATLYADAEDEEVLPRTRFWLRKARGCPLDITLRTSAQEHATAAVMRMLGAHAGQIRRLSVDTASVDEAELVLSRCPPRMEALEFLKIATQGLGPSDADQGMLFRDAFEHSPRLRTLHLTSDMLTPFVSFPATIETLKWTLSAVPVNMIGFTQALLTVVFPALPMLAEFNFEVDTIPWDEDLWEQRSGEIQVCALDRLHTLRLHVPPHLNVILDKLSCPALSSLTLSSSQGSDAIPHADTGMALINLLARSTPPIALLSLYDVDLTDAAFLACFKLLPGLEDLRLHWSDITVETIGELARSLCPQLTHLDLRWCSHLEGGALVDLVRTRQRSIMGEPVRAIEEIAILNCPVVEEQAVLELAGLTVCRVTLRPQDDPCRA